MAVKSVPMRRVRMMLRAWRDATHRVRAARLEGFHRMLEVAAFSLDNRLRAYFACAHLHRPCTMHSDGLP